MGIRDRFKPDPDRYVDSGLIWVWPMGRTLHFQNCLQIPFLPRIESFDRACSHYTGRRADERLRAGDGLCRHNPSRGGSWACATCGLVWCVKAQLVSRKPARITHQRMVLEPSCLRRELRKACSRKKDPDESLVVVRARPL